MITEDYVSFKTAKLLKEKGFDELSIIFYSLDGNGEITLFDDEPLRNSEIDGYAKVTLQMAMKWLREKHNIIISIHPNDFKSNGTACYKADIWIKDKYVYEYEYNKEGNYDYTDREKRNL